MGLLRIWLGGAFGEGYDLICGDVFEGVGWAADPADFDLVDGFVVCESEVEAHSVMALVASAAVDFVDLGEVACGDFYSGSDAVAVGLCAAKMDLE